MFIRQAILLTCIFSVPSARSADREPLKEKSGAATESVIAERRATFNAANNAVSAAMAKAGHARAKHNIVDRDPGSAGGVAGDKDDPKIAEYLKLKDAYLEAIAASKRAGDALRDVLPSEELKIYVESGESMMASSFAAMAELLQSGDITDPNVDDASSAVSVTGNNPEIARTYLSLKSKYLAGKGRAADARAALERRKSGTKAPNR